MFTLHDETDETDETDELNGDGQRRRRRNGDWRARLEGEGDTEWACRAAQEGPRELGATVLMAVAAGLGSFFGREGVCRLLMWYRSSKGLDPGDPALPFPSWEVQVCSLSLVLSDRVAVGVGRALNASVGRDAGVLDAVPRLG